MKWLEALGKVHKPTLTNQEASGLIRFGRSVFAAYGRQPQLALTPFDWYAYALPALGWFTEGDKFKVDTKHQLAPYPTPLQLWEALNGIARELDAQGVEFKMVTDPRGSDSGYRTLANEAWTAMQADRAAAAAEAKLRTIPGVPGQGTSDEPWDAGGKIGPATKRETTPPPPPAPRSSGGGLLLLLLLFGLGKQRR